MPRARKPVSPFRYFNSPPKVIRLVVLIYVRFPPSLRDVEDLPFERGIDKRHGSPEAITTDGLRSHGAAMDELGNREKQETGRWASNRVENSRLPFRRRGRAMLGFGQMKTPQKFASVRADVLNHFSLERHLVDRRTHKDRRSAALAEWKVLAS